MRDFTIHQNRHLIRIIVAFLLVIHTSYSTQAKESLRPESYLPQLKEILQSARQNAPELVEESFLRKEADQRLLQAKSDYFPSLDLGANFGVRRQYRDNDENTSNFGFNYSARLTRPIYHWGAIEAKIEQARIDNDTKTLNYLENTRLIFRRIRSDYLTLLLNEITLRNENTRKENLQSELEKVEIDYNAGKISQISYNSIQLDLQNSLLLIKNIERNQKQIINRFQQTAGWNNKISSDEKIPELNLETLLAWLKAESESNKSGWTNTHYISQITHNEMKEKGEELKIIKASQRPLLNFTARATQDQSNTSTANNVDTLTLFAGLSVSWNIFDGFYTKHRTIEANLKQRRLETKLIRLKNELLLQKQQMIDAIQFQLENTLIFRERHDLQKKQFKIEQREFETGRQTQNDIRASKLKLMESELQLMTAHADLLMHLSDYSDLTMPMTD